MRDVVSYPDIHTLINFLKIADRTRFWEQRHLEEWHLPYVFLSTCEFPPTTGKLLGRRAEWLRFRFDGRFRTLEDLWIRGRPDFKFLRLLYRAPKRKDEPGRAEFIKPEQVRVDSDWMSRSYATPHPYSVAAIERAFPAEVGAPL